MSAASLPRPARRPFARVLAGYVALTKPRILPLVIFTALPVLLMASAGLAQSLGILAGISLAAAAANALNMYVERDRDALMERTRTRPLPTAELAPRAALVFGLALASVATVALQWVAGTPAALLGVASILFYVFVYTIWLKPRTPYNAVIGGAAGAAAPLIADAAVHGSVGWPGLLLFAIVFFWQPPHVWAIALYRKADYAAAGIPMMPAAVGDERTRWRMLWYTFGLLPVTILPALPALHLLGAIYLTAAVGLGAWFTWTCVRLIRERSDAAAQRVFRVSLVYLAALYLAMLVDLLAGSAPIARPAAVDFSALPALNAALNATAAVLLVRGRLLARRGAHEAHRRTMLAAFGVSSAFLASYLVHKASRSFHSTTFHATGVAKTAYLAMLATHVVLAACVPVLAIVLIRFGLRGEIAHHRRLARVAWPIWLYVSVTGVAIYFLLYRFNPPAS